MWKRLGLFIAAVIAGFAITGAGHHQPMSGGPENADAAAAVATTTGIAEGEPDPLQVIPADFADFMGYRPVLVDGPDGEPRVVNPNGDCSSPFGPTTFGFDQACNAHDFGYDLLRYAAATGGELGPWARRAIDQSFAEDMAVQCLATDGGPACGAVATAYDLAVQVNSWRQGQGVPGPERPAPYVAAIGLILAALVLPPVIVRIEGRLRRPAPIPAPVPELAVTVK